MKTCKEQGVRLGAMSWNFGVGVNRGWGFWFPGLLIFRIPGFQDFRFSGLGIFRTSSFLGFPAFHFLFSGLLVFRVSGFVDVWSSGFLAFQDFCFSGLLLPRVLNFRISCFCCTPIPKSREIALGGPLAPYMFSLYALSPPPVFLF